MRPARGSGASRPPAWRGMTQADVWRRYDAVPPGTGQTRALRRSRRLRYRKRHPGTLTHRPPWAKSTTWLHRELHAASADADSATEHEHEAVRSAREADGDPEVVRAHRDEDNDHDRQ